MFAIERQSKIKEILFKEKRVDVYELSQRFSVTEVTIRRDLDKLEKEGYLIKTYGGAVLKEDYSKEIEPYAEDDTNEEKKLIGKIASQMIQNDEAIYLGPGKTCLEIAKNIKNKKITVVTNDISIGAVLKDSAGIKVIITGGDLIHSTGTLVGEFALNTLKNIFINKAFIGVKGIHLESGFTVNSHEEVRIFQEIKKISNEIIVVADYTKFNHTAFAKLGDITMSKKIITNKEIPNKYKSFFFENNIKLYTTYEFK
ncbi:MAG: DeoR/GlpR transcriptional regulator [Clostridiaceae bacterium]|nr:DeoR/GlpR transcriptional regulator [Clostridiaceae bacterium]